MQSAPQDATDAVRESGLIEAASTGVVLSSGGADSACATAGLAGLCGAGSITALHLNYALRDDSGLDEEASRELCEGLGVELVVMPVNLDAGNVQAAAREARYAAAERLRAERGAAWIATGHTRTDLAETVIYRLVTSPGRRSLLGLAPRRGNLVRPLLGISRERAREIVRGAGLPFRDDPSNATAAYSRNRIRNEVLPVLNELAPALEQTIASTWAELAEESEALEALAAELLESRGIGAAAPAVAIADLQAFDPALRRIALRSLAERIAAHPVPLDRERCERIMRLGQSPEGGTVELGSGVIASVEHGHVRLSAGPEALPEAARLPLPGQCRFGIWELRSELIEAGSVDAAGPEVAALDAELLGAELQVRSWRDGDRIRPLGLDGTKSLQDLFTDAKVPRSLRRRLPVVTAGERIAWVAGVAVSEELRARSQTRRVALLRASSI